MHAYLAAHPQIFMSQQKELHYFLDNSWGAWKFGERWYYRQFEEGKELPVRGESSPGYSIDGFTSGVAEKMATLIPHAKLVYMLREPLSRVRSHYTEELYNRHIPAELTLEQILAAGPDEPGLLGDNYRGIVQTSLYYRQLSYYLQHYALEQFHFITMEAMETNPQGTLAELFRFLGVANIIPTNLDRKLNEKASKRLRIVNPTAFVRGLPKYETLSRAVPTAVKGAYRRAISRKIDHEKLMAIKPESERHLRALFAPDIAQLRAVTALPLTEWSI